MKKRTKIVAGLFAVLLVIGWLVWRFMPVHFLREVDPKDVAVIDVRNGNNGNQFEVTDSDDIAGMITSIQQITFRRKTIASDIDRWYFLTFLDENGEEIDSIGIQNRHSVRKDMTQKTSIFFFCDGELDEIGDRLERLESAQYPDYNKDPDFDETRDGAS